MLVLRAAFLRPCVTFAKLANLSFCNDSQSKHNYKIKRTFRSRDARDSERSLNGSCETLTCLHSAHTRTLASVPPKTVSMNDAGSFADGVSVVRRRFLGGGLRARMACDR